MTKNTTFRILLLLSVLSFFAASGVIFHHIRYHHETLFKIKTDLQRLTIKATKDIEAILRQAVSDVDAVANKQTNSKIDKSEILHQISTLILKSPNYYGSTICYRPFVYDPAKRLFAPYYHRISGNQEELKFIKLEEEFDYTKYDWFEWPMNIGNSWTEPYWNPASKTMVVTYSSVFYDTEVKTGKKTPLGVVTIEISMDNIKRIIEGINLGASGFGALISSKGVFMYYPNSEYVVLKKTITEVAKENNDPDLLVMAEKAARGESGFLDHVSTSANEKSWLVFEPIPLTGWSLQSTFLKKDIAINVDNYRHNLIWIVVLVLLFFLLALGCIYTCMASKIRNAWIIIISGSLLIIVALGCIWSITLTYNPADKINGIKISDKATLQSTLSNLENRSSMTGKVSQADN